MNKRLIYAWLATGIVGAIVYGIRPRLAASGVLSSPTMIAARRLSSAGMRREGLPNSFMRYLNTTYRSSYMPSSSSLLNKQQLFTLYPPKSWYSPWSLRTKSGITSTPQSTATMPSQSLYARLIAWWKKSQEPTARPHDTIGNLQNDASINEQFNKTMNEIKTALGNSYNMLSKETQQELEKLVKSYATALVTSDILGEAEALKNQIEIKIEKLKDTMRSTNQLSL